MIEKRKEPRFKVDTEIYVFNSSTDVSFVGKILDISRSGIAFSYIMDFPIPDELSELGLLVPSMGSVLKNMPFNTAYDDVFTNDVLITTVMRRRGGHFHSLMPDQENRLERFAEDFVNSVADYDNIHQDPDEI